MYKTILRATDMVHSMVKGAIKENSIAVDATLGTGKDTIFLSELVPKGRVYSFDIQADAISKYICNYGEAENVTLINDGHENMLNYLKEQPSIIMFNLGYLPCGDKSIITKPETTVKALRAGIEIIAPNGIISIISYIGHDGGEEEATLIGEVTRSLNPKEFAVMEIKFSNTNGAPFITIIEKNCNYHEGKYSNPCLYKNE
jgi:hypothetical protein